MELQKPFVAYTYTPEDVSSKRRRVIKFWVLFVLIVAFLIIFSSFALWRFSPGPKWRTLVVDKTVPHPDYREHRALFWILNHAKVVNKGGKRIWRPGRNYVGFYPKKFIASDAPFSSNLEPNHLVGVNLLFIADTYGVYIDDYRYPEQHRTHLDSSRKIFGGLELQEVEIIEEFVEKGGSLVAEFNTFYSPSSEIAQERMENLLGLECMGWVGRYFVDLSNREDVPGWARRNWETHYREEWNFTGPGFIIAHQDSRLFVLEDEKDVESGGLQIIPKLPEDPMMKGVSSIVPYRYWFDIVSPKKGTEVLARYRFRLTLRGKEKMGKFAVPETFPAVLRASRSPLLVYFAGDFSDNNVYQGPYFFFGWTKLRRILCCLGTAKSQNRFFWRFYIPLLKNLFNLNYS